jgi:carbohydrate kinase (thermoresistant glucokinase family)
LKTALSLHKALRRRALWFLAQQMQTQSTVAQTVASLPKADSVMQAPPAITPQKHEATSIRHIIVMGVSGCGKSTLARALAQELGWPMIEGDEYHPAANIAKMAAGTPLNDADRAPWLVQLNLELKKCPHAVLSCSALKTRYRDILRTDLPHTMMVHAHGDFETLLARTQSRQASGNHFMPASLLRSQFDVLEMPSAAEQYVTVSCDDDTAQQVSDVIRFLNR